MTARTHLFFSLIKMESYKNAVREEFRRTKSYIYYMSNL